MKSEEINKGLKTASFDESLHFGGEKGLLSEYYGGYRNALLYAVVVEFTVRLNEVELCTLDMTRPVYIDGTYYMLITVAVQTNKLAVCKAIKLPPDGKYFKKNNIKQ